ncbi:hypothetical protein HOY82DRAFT_83058 [Tuber indicum]|nr:hypothetical protein HOY82DRAFT_83058 [Tuber indicum]
MSQNRSLGRNVSFCDATQPDIALGGLIQNGSITEANFLDILAIILVEGGSLRVQGRVSGHILCRTDVPLKTGVYDIYSDASVQVSDEPWVPRLIYRDTSWSEDRFTNCIRNRDRKCVISGISNPEVHIQANNWTTFEAAHIFPPEHETLWVRDSYGRWITDMDRDTEFAKIYSTQNGFLLQLSLRTLFDGYLISINPDDGYKVVVFGNDMFGCDGKILDTVCRNPDDPHRVSDELLRWHFRQSVLANVRGVGEPIFEHDFPPGTDTVGEILAGQYGQERFGLEIAAWLSRVSAGQHAC